MIIEHTQHNLAVAGRIIHFINGDAWEARLHLDWVIGYMRKNSNVTPLRVDFHEGEPETFRVLRGNKWDACKADIVRSMVAGDAWKIRIAGGNDAIILEII